MNIDHHQILNFWYEEIQPKQWWVKDLAFDQSMADRFSECYQVAIHGELSTWRKTAEGRLAEIIVIDRFGRYPHRNKILARESTAEELEFLTQKDSSF
ncbi:MAG: DUF924 domain-containing protein [Proteobacteria bacterium]|nr:DUF924 domain-containing protein [Pseudomonadota bacterium]